MLAQFVKSFGYLWLVLCEFVESCDQCLLAVKVAWQRDASDVRSHRSQEQFACTGIIERANGVDEFVLALLERLPIGGEFAQQTDASSEQLSPRAVTSSFSS